MNYTSHTSVWISAMQFTVEISLVASNVHSSHECLTFISVHLCLQFACVAWCCHCELLFLLPSPLFVVLKNHCTFLFFFFFNALLCSRLVHDLYLYRDNYIMYIYMKASLPCWEPNLVFLQLVSWLIHSHYAFCLTETNQKFMTQQNKV